MEAATAADLTQASEIAGRYITLGSAAKCVNATMTLYLKFSGFAMPPTPFKGAFVYVPWVLLESFSNQ